MVSPPESLEFRDNNDSTISLDVFQTPPEDSTALSSAEEQKPPAVAMDGRKQERSDDDVVVDGGSETVVVDVGFPDDSGTGTVELGLDSELGFSEAQDLQRVNSRSDSLGFRVLSGEEEKGSAEPPLKKSKIPSQNSAKSAGGSESGEESLAKMKSEFEVVRSEIEANDGVLEEGNAKGGVKDGVTSEGILGLNELQSNGQEKKPAREFMETVAMADEHGKWQPRVLPNWIRSAVDNENENEVKKVQSNSYADEGCRKYSILYALELLQKLGDDSVPRDGFVEICKQQGMIFPRPRWWPEGGFKLIDGDDNDH